MSSTISTLSLAELLRDHLHAPAPDEKGASAAVELVNGARTRELTLRRWIPARLLRRLDRGFARSYTIHPDTARVLYAVTRAIKPAVVMETGTYWGYSTTVLAAALRDEGAGVVHSFDLYPNAGAHIPRELRARITLHLGKPGTESMPALLATCAPQLFFQDSVHDYDGVLAELRVAAPSLAPGAVILFHDFVLEGVRQAAVDALPGYFIARIDVDDPQQLGIALAPI